MRRNNFSSAADRRWQRRYERIQQRREDELERRERRGRDAEERIEDQSRQLDLYAELIRRQEEELLQQILAAKERRREEQERAMWAEFERWIRSQRIVFDDNPVEFELEPEPEPELSAGDDAALDGFLGNFLAPGA